MRKIDHHKKRSQLRRALQKFHKKIKRKVLLRARRQIKSGYVTSKALKIVHQIKISAPKVFELSHPKRRQEFLRFIQNLRKWQELNKRITIDFSNVELLRPCGVILFVAELSRLRELTAKKFKIRAVYPKDPLVDEMFQHLGIIEELGLKPRRNISHHQVKYWTSYYGTNVDLSGLGSLHQSLTLELGEEKATNLFSAMQEAITNVVHHAYIEPRELNRKDINKGWWLFAEHKNGVVYLSICDRGIGIRRTLPMKLPLYKNLLETIAKSIGSSIITDCSHIKTAIEAGNTRTKQQNRGKGLYEMREVVLQSSAGSLRIYSDKGVYFVNHKNLEVSKEYKNSVRGTIIQWSFNPNDVKQTYQG